MPERSEYGVRAPVCPSRSEAPVAAGASFRLLFSYVDTFDMSNDPFFKRLVYISLGMVFLLVTGVLFGPWQIDPNASILIALVAQPGGVALGVLLKGRGE